MNWINIVVKKVGELPYIASYENDFELGDMQSLIGGYVECVRITDEIDMWVNEEGALRSLPLNLFLSNGTHTLDGIVGNVFFASHDDEGNVIGLNEIHDGASKVVDMLMNRYIFGYSEVIDGSAVYPILEVVK